MVKRLKLSFLVGEKQLSDLNAVRVTGMTRLWAIPANTIPAVYTVLGT